MTYQWVYHHRKDGVDIKLFSEDQEVARFVSLVKRSPAGLLDGRFLILFLRWCRVSFDELYCQVDKAPGLRPHDRAVLMDARSNLIATTVSVIKKTEGPLEEQAIYILRDAEQEFYESLRRNKVLLQLQERNEVI